MTRTRGATLYRKIWDAHLVDSVDDGAHLLAIDRQLIYEGSSRPAFEGLKAAGRSVRRPDSTLAMADHTVPTRDRSAAAFSGTARARVAALELDCSANGIRYLALDDHRHGIVHVVGPEQGFTQPGMVVVCPDSHTSTHGAFGALAFGIGSSELEHVLATQTLVQRPSKTFRVCIEGLPHGAVYAKDLALAVISRLGASGAVGHGIEFAGETVRALSMSGRMTLCNMAVECGARSALVAPDDTTFAWLKDRPLAPSGARWSEALAYWRSLRSDEDAVFDRELRMHVGDLAPQITWGTSPDETIAVTGRIPDPADAPDATRAAAWINSLAYMGLTPGTAMADISIDRVFIGSCTNSRLEDLRAAAAVVRGHHIAHGVHGMVVPGSDLVKRGAEAEGLDRIFIDAGFEWRHAGCSMCFGNQFDLVGRGQRCVSTSNRNFEHRQGPGARTHLASPATAAASGIAGRFVDVRDQR